MMIIPSDLTLSSISPANQGDENTLSWTQERLWFLTQWEGDAAAYVHVGAIRLEGALNTAMLRQSLAHISQRQEIMRTRFDSGQGQGQAYIAAQAQVRLPVQDLRGLAEQEQAEQSEAVMAGLRGSLDVSQGTLLQFALLWLTVETHMLVFAAHQLIWDGHSDGIFLQELAASYGQHKGQATLPLQYQALAQQERQWLQEKSGQRALAYWEKQLSRLPPPLALASRGSRPAVQRLASASQSFTVSAAVARGLTAVSQAGETAVSVILLAAFKALLWRYTGQTDLVVGMETTGRGTAARAEMIGPLGNTVVMRSDLRGNPSFREALGRVSKTARAAAAYEEMPFAVLVNTLARERDISRPPLCQVAFSCEETRERATSTSVLRLQCLAVAAQTSPFDLRLGMAVGEPLWTGVFTYNTDLFHGATIERMVAHFQELLASIAANPEQRLSELSLLTARERQQLLVEWNATERVYPQQQGLHEMFAAQAAQTPEAIAVVYEDSCLTYGQLERRANQLAHYLRQQGVGPDTLVGICLERTLEMVVALLGILKAGGGYVPLDPAYPAERQGYILADSGARLLLTSAAVQPQLPATAVTVVRLEEVATVVAGQLDTAPSVPVRAANIAYVIYTSGSTGQPKGVLITHGNALSLIHWAQETFAPTLFQGILAATSLCFDLSVFELFVPLSGGGCIILAENALELPRLPAATAVRLVNTVPSAMRELLRLQGLPGSVQVVNLAGEPLSVALVDQLYQQVGLETVYDLYGPSEDTTYSTYIRREAGAAATIGRPIANTQAYLLDGHLQPVPVGVPGELYLGGAGLARGYHARPGMTAEKFIPHPFSPVSGARLYKTGDLARCRADGNLEFLGRIDHQVKVRGYRIELGEIEAVLSGHEAIAETVVQVREDAGAAPQLVAYVVAEAGQAPGSGELRQFLQRRLPEYMVPAHVVMLEALPLTPNGKIDRRALPAPEQANIIREDLSVLPRDALELRLAKIWEDVLGLGPIGVTHSFFDLGGHSLLAVRLMMHIQQDLQCQLPLATLFQHNTVERLAVALRQHRQAPTTPFSPLVLMQQGSAGKRPLFFVHPVGGNVFCYVALIQHLETAQPFYALQSRGLDGLQTPYTTIEEMADCYIQAIRTVQTEGPYLLGGWSMGGLIAFEMAQQLQAQGQDVSFLALIDSHTPGSMQAANPETDPLELLMNFALDLGLPLDQITLHLADLIQLTPDERLGYILQQAKQAGITPPDIELSQIHHLYQVFESNMQAIDQYQPQAYNGPVTLFKASESLNEGILVPDLGWYTLTSGNLTIYETSGNHFTIMRTPNVTHLVKHLEALLPAPKITSQMRETED